MGLTGRLKHAREEQGAPMAPRARINPTPAPVLPARFNDAIQFVLAVKREFAGETGKYEKFLAILHEYQSISRLAVLDRIKVLLSGHPDLLRGLNMFFRRCYEPKDDKLQGQAAANVVGKVP